MESAVRTILIASAVYLGSLPTARAQIPPAICASVFQPTGDIMERWNLTGGPSGPMGCAAGPAHSAPQGNGQVMPFQNGEIVTSPDQGPHMTVAVYQRDADLVVEWGDTAPFNYDKFIVRVDKNGTNVGQRDIGNGFRTRGLWFVPTPAAGTYSIIVEGCDTGLGGSSCKQGWTVPAVINYVAPPVPVMKNPDCDFPVTGDILARWNALGGQNGPLGCPIEKARPIAGAHAFANPKAPATVKI